MCPSNVLGGLCTKVVQVVKNIISLPEAVTEMEDQAQRLDNVIRGINQKLAQEQKAPQIIVKAWLDKAGQAIESSRSIDNEYQQQRNCLSCCPNCFSRYTISKHVGDWKVKVAQLHSEKEADFPPNGEYGEPTPPTQIPIQTPKLFGTGIEAAQSELERWLIEDMSIRVIGVCGMGGVGKTSLLQTINNSDKVRQTFNPIIWVTVSKDPKILNLQKCIAGRLNITLPDECDFEGRKSALYAYLKDKNFLLILDDMWESLELQSLGVSLDDTACKIVLSTRSTAVCTRMRVDKIISVKPLSDDEAWQLFCSGAFRHGNVPQEMEDVARKVAGECKGLPLAINVIAAAMRNHSYQHEWVHALHQMQTVEETFYGTHDEIEKELFQRLKLSYNVLPEYMKICFLYFAAYPEDEEIEVKEIIDLWVAEGLVKGSGENYLPDTAHSFVNHLSDRCLIEVVWKDNVGRIQRVKIHANAERKNACLKDLQTLSRLRICRVKIKSAVKEGVFGNWSKMRDLYLDWEDANGQDYLPQDMQAMKDLESLTLRYCDVERLPSWVTQFRKLAYLWLYECKELKYLRADLPCLRQLGIVNCDELEELELGMGAVGAASASGGLGEGASPLSPMLKYVDVINCPKLKRLRGGWDKLNHLEEIVGGREWWDAIEWEDPNMKTLLQNKFKEL